MKLTLLALVFLFSIHATLAQRDPSNEVLVYFKEGVVRERGILNGKEFTRQSIKSERLKVALSIVGVDEGMLEPALPNFNEADTMRRLADGNTVALLNMSKLCRIRVKEGLDKNRLIEKLNALPEVLYAESNGGVAHHAIPSDTYFDAQWGLKNNVYPGRDIHAEGAWGIYTGNTIISSVS